MVAEHQRARQVHLAAADVAVDVDAAGHDDAAGELDGLVELRARPGIVDDAPVADVEVAGDALGRIIPGRDLREVITAIERQLGVNLTIRWAPGRSIDIPRSILAIERAEMSLGWKPKTRFDTGLALTIDWIRDNRAVIEQRAR